MSFSAPDHLRLLSVKEVLGLFSMGRNTFYKAVKAGEIRTVKRGRRRLVAAADAAAYVETLRGQGAFALT
jgi:excisionase family DNA binding protein